MSRLPALLVGVLLAAGLTTGCEATGGAGGCRPSSAAPAVEIAPKPKPKMTAARKPVCTKANSPVWQGFQPYRGDIRTNGKSGSKQSSSSGTRRTVTSRCTTTTAITSAAWTRRAEP